MEYFRLDMPLSNPYTIAYETIHKTSNIVLKIVSDTGLVGWGCAAPDVEVTGESPEDVIEYIDTTIAGMLIGQSPFQISRFNHLLKEQLKNAHSALTMVDMALYDLMARKAKLPLYKMLGGYRGSIATSITIGIIPLHDTLELATEYLRRGFTIIKVKGGTSKEEDIEKVLTIREKFGNDFSLRFDANQGYSFDESIDFIEKTKSARIEIFEQPTNRKKDERLGRITESVEVPVMADESLKTLKDAFHLTSNGLINMVNIKLMKVGGITDAKHINSVAKAAGVEVMIGCLDECALGISAGLHFALSRPNIEYADLDGHLELLNDPFDGLFDLKGGVLFPSEHHGLGKINL